MEHKKDKIKPSQPFFVLGAEDFVQEVYLHQGISHFYSFRLTHETDLIAVPDGCIDLIFEYGENGMNAYACGTVLKCSRQHWQGRQEIFGVRFMPGYVPAGIKSSLRDLIEKRIVLYDIMGNADLIESMRNEKDFFQRIRVFIEGYTRLEKRQEAPYGKLELCMTVKDLAYESAGLMKVSEFAEQTGYTERYIDKVFLEYMGFSPKTFCKIIQFQNAIETLNQSPTVKMTEIAVNLGYYDQAKFIKDFKMYAGITPSRYVKLILEKQYYGRINSSDLYNFA